MKNRCRTKLPKDGSENPKPFFEARCFMKKRKEKTKKKKQEKRKEEEEANKKEVKRKQFACLWPIRKCVR